jgi:hypothetical protein
MMQLPYNVRHLWQAAIAIYRMSLLVMQLPYNVRHLWQAAIAIYRMSPFDDAIAVPGMPLIVRKYYLLLV